MKKYVSLTLAIALVFELSGCAIQKTDGTFDASVFDNPSTADVRVAGCLDFTGVALAKLDNEFSDRYAVTFLESSKRVVSLVADGKADIAVCSPVSAARLYNTTGGGIIILAVSSVGGEYILTKKEDVSNVRSLKNETVYYSSSEPGMITELTWLLEKNNVYVEGGKEPENDDPEFVPQYSVIKAMESYGEVAAAALDGTADTVILPEPYASKVTKASTLRKGSSLGDEWEKISDGSVMITGCVVAGRDFVNNHPQEIEQFLADYAKSVEFFNEENEMQAAELLTDKGFFTSVDVASDAISSCGIIFIKGLQMKTMVAKFLSALYAVDKTFADGDLPDDGFCYVSP